MSLWFIVNDTFHVLFSSCIPTPSLTIHRRNFKVIKLLGEGGFSFVYLVQDAATGQVYALKKIRCAGDSEALVAAAMREAEMYKRFKHPNVIEVYDTNVTNDPDGAKVVYIFLPYFERGNLQDAINQNFINNIHFSEREMLRFFKGICTAVNVLHTYRLPDSASQADEPQTGFGDQMDNVNELDRDEEQDVLLNDISTSVGQQEEYRATRGGELEPYAHRDIKPGNVMISDDGKTPVLMDFGSVQPARIEIKTRQQALLQQDLAAEHCSMPYRAPELFDVKTGETLDEKVDVWSLGCTLYCMAYGQSPFESRQSEQGGSIALAVLNGAYRFPTTPPMDTIYSDVFKDLIRSMLQVKPQDRPTVSELLQRVDALL
ncbi:hypothetical protein BZG36_03932 [Bifiguratus adelaidae]|uniref:non-specific serine/threonine protein kinase n=1 Tax=Bifiguratus adelaidae TaxID=1938954 RepID=A0A261XZ90_9FUNG|nr:hypothetical protein BZG36_03932 [Bifiguratus adelaidae]